MKYFLTWHRCGIRQHVNDSIYLILPHNLLHIQYWMDYIFECQSSSRISPLYTQSSISPLHLWALRSLPAVTIKLCRDICASCFWLLLTPYSIIKGKHWVLQPQFWLRYSDVTVDRHTCYLPSRDMSRCEGLQLPRSDFSVLACTGVYNMDWRTIPEIVTACLLVFFSLAPWSIHFS